ncbi:MAG: D-alanyl-D-alanine dipeptidase, partial [Mesorhizobium sp.]
PLSCRTSPPQGGRSDVAPGFANLQRRVPQSQTGDACNEVLRHGEMGA